MYIMKFMKLIVTLTIHKVMQISNPFHLSKRQAERYLVNIHNCFLVDRVSSVIPSIVHANCSVLSMRLLLSFLFRGILLVNFIELVINMQILNLTKQTFFRVLNAHVHC